jgi:hypothetical protein
MAMASISAPTTGGLVRFSGNPELLPSFAGLDGSKTRPHTCPTPAVISRRQESRGRTYGEYARIVRIWRGGLIGTRMMC